MEGARAVSGAYDERWRTQGHACSCGYGKSIAPPHHCCHPVQLCAGPSIWAGSGHLWTALPATKPTTIALLFLDTLAHHHHHHHYSPYGVLHGECAALEFRAHLQQLISQVVLQALLCSQHLLRPGPKAEVGHISSISTWCTAAAGGSSSMPCCRYLPCCCCVVLLRLTCLPMGVVARRPAHVSRCMSGKECSADIPCKSCNPKGTRQPNRQPADQAPLAGSAAS